MFVIEVNHTHRFVGGADPRIDHIIALLEGFKMDLTQLQASLTQLRADVAAETSLDQSIVAFVQGTAARIADLETQLAAAIAKLPSTEDVAALQAVVDGMRVVHTDMTSNATATAAALQQNTVA